MLSSNLSDTAATSQDGSSLEFTAPIAGSQCYILGFERDRIFVSLTGVEILFS